MGLWLVQQAFPERSADELSALARGAKPFAAKFDVNHPNLLNPKSMSTAIRSLADGNLNSDGALYHAILENLAASYARAVADIERITTAKVSDVCVVGGGSKNALLNQMTADACARPVFAGPAEATALGNALVQLQSLGVLEDARLDGRAKVRKAYPQAVFEPKETAMWEEWING
jgi:rhamnulokinase